MLEGWDIKSSKGDDMESLRSICYDIKSLRSIGCDIKSLRSIDDDIRPLWSIGSDIPLSVKKHRHLCSICCKYMAK